MEKLKKVKRDSNIFKWIERSKKSLIEPEDSRIDYSI